MKYRAPERRFPFKRAAGMQRLTFGVEMTGTRYAIRLEGKVIKSRTAGFLSEDCDRIATLRQLAVNDIDQLTERADGVEV